MILATNSFNLVLVVVLIIINMLQHHAAAEFNYKGAAVPLEYSQQKVCQVVVGLAQYVSCFTIDLLDISEFNIYHVSFSL